MNDLFEKTTPQINLNQLNFIQGSLKMQRLTSLGFQLRNSATSGFSQFPFLLNKSPLSAWSVPSRSFGVVKRKQVPFPKWKIVKGDRVRTKFPYIKLK